MYVGTAVNRSHISFDGLGLYLIKEDFDWMVLIRICDVCCRVLILHLKRYNYNTVSTVQSKMLQNIVIPKYLSLYHQCVEDTTKPHSVSFTIPR